MYFNDSLLAQAVELTLILLNYVTGDQGSIDLDRLEEIESCVELCYSILSICGDALYLTSLKLYWKAAASCIATIEGDTGDGVVRTPTTIEVGHIRALSTLQHPDHEHLQIHLAESISFLHHVQAFLRAGAHHTAFLDRNQDCLLILANACQFLGHPHTPQHINNVHQ